MAYNNGIVIVADQVRLGEAPEVARYCVDAGMQIVNGGQTTASMFFTKRNFRQPICVTCVYPQK